MALAAVVWVVVEQVAVVKVMGEWVEAAKGEVAMEVGEQEVVWVAVAMVAVVAWVAVVEASGVVARRERCRLQTSGCARYTSHCRYTTR